MKFPFGSRESRRALLLTVLLIAAIWALAFMGPLSFGIIPFMLAGVWLAITRRHPLPLAVLLVNPMAVAFVMGVVAWFGERPSFIGHGLPASSAFNLDRNSRIWPGVGGCVVHGNEWVADIPYNSALSMTAANFGLPKKTYHGVYPTIGEVRELTAKAVKTPGSQFLEGSIVTESGEIKIGKSFAEATINDLGQFFIDEDSAMGKGEVSAVVVGSQCLILRIVSEADFSRDEKRRDGAMLVDLKTMMPFARYSFEGTLPRVPRYATDNLGRYGRKVF